VRALDDSEFLGLGEFLRIPVDPGLDVEDLLCPFVAYLQPDLLPRGILW